MRPAAPGTEAPRKKPCLSRLWRRHGLTRLIMPFPSTLGWARGAVRARKALGAGPSSFLSAVLCRPYAGAAPCEAHGHLHPAHYTPLTPCLGPPGPLGCRHTPDPHSPILAGERQLPQHQPGDPDAGPTERAAAPLPAAAAADGAQQEVPWLPAQQLP